MRGHIRVGRWLPFRARQVLTPHEGFLWAARAAGLISGFDWSWHGAGGMAWKLAGLVSLVRSGGPDVARAGPGRAGAEAIWVPTALLPRFGVRWTVGGGDEVTAEYRAGGTPVTLRYTLDADGRITSLAFPRWGDPEGTGTWGWYPFGGLVTAHRVFGGVTIPSAGCVGWHFGTDGWPRGEFFRYEITDLELVSAAAPAPHEDIRNAAASQG